MELADETARLVEEDGALVAAGETPVDDEVVSALISEDRSRPLSQSS